MDSGSAPTAASRNETKSRVILPAVHGKRRSRYETGILGREEYHAARNLLRLAEAIDRNLRQDVLVENVLRHRLHHFGVDVARTDYIHGDAALGILQRERLGEAYVAGLGRGIVDLAELPLLAIDRRDVDDTAELAGAHALDHLPRHVEQRTEIGVDHRVPLLERHLVEGGILGDAGIVDQHVDRTEIRLDLLDAGDAGVERTDVPFIDGDAGLGLEFFRRRVIACVARRHLVACGLQRLADRSPNAPRSPLHQCNTCHIEIPPWWCFLASQNYHGLLTASSRWKCPGRARSAKVDP